jgi:hypothetical protein
MASDPAPRAPAGQASKVSPLMRFLPRALVACGTGFAVSLLAACGGGAGLLSGDQSNSLSTQLDQVGSAVAASDCAAAINAAQAFNNAVTNLPDTINPTLKANLDQGGSTVAALAALQCRQTTTTTSPTTSSTTSSTATTTSTSTPTTTPTTTSTTTTTPTTTTETSTTGTGTTPTNPSGGGGLPGGGAGPAGGNGNGNGQNG